MALTINVNGTYGITRAVTSIGNSISSPVTSIPKTSAYYIQDGSGSINTIYRPNGIGLGDFAEVYNEYVQFSVNWTSYVDISGNFIKTDGNIFYAIYSQVNSTSGLYSSTPAWDVFNAYVVGNKVIYFDGVTTNVYTCIQDIDAGVGQPPNADLAYWNFTDSFYNLRIVPSEDSSNPLLKGSNRFNYYSVLTCFSVDATTLSNYKFKLNTATTASAAFGAAVTVDGANGNTSLAIQNVDTVVLNTTVTGTHDPTAYPFIVNKKIIIRDSAYPLPYTATVTASSSTGFTATISTLGAWGSATVYNYGDFVTYASKAYLNINTASTTTGASRLPTNATYWTEITSGIFSTVDTVISGWDLFIDNKRFNPDIKPINAFCNSNAEMNFNVV